jgi:acetyl-CoA carboxylase biotin carboxyl carrier protein
VESPGILRDPLLDRSGVSSDQLTQVLDAVAGSDIAELDITIGATRISLRRPPVAVPAPAWAAPQGPDAPSFLAISSPLVGIFQAVVHGGETIQSGQPIGAIEALGIPTNVDAPEGGIVEDVLVQDGSPVEYGQPLLTLRRGPAHPELVLGSS